MDHITRRESDPLSLSNRDHELIRFHKHLWLVDDDRSLGTFHEFNLPEELLLVLYVFKLLKVVFFYIVSTRMSWRFLSRSNYESRDEQLTLSHVWSRGMEDTDPSPVELVIQGSVQSREPYGVSAYELIQPNRVMVVEFYKQIESL